MYVPDIYSLNSHTTLFVVFHNVTPPQMLDGYTLVDSDNRGISRQRL